MFERLLHLAKKAIVWFAKAIGEILLGVLRLGGALVIIIGMLWLHRYFFAPDRPIEDTDIIFLLAAVAYLRASDSGGRKDG